MGFNMEYDLLGNIVIILAFSILVLLLCYRFKIPEIIGFFITGLLMGPHGFGVFTEMHEIDFLAEIGVVLLLFTIGLEFSLKSLIKLKRQFFIGGTVQIGLVIVAAFLISLAIGLPTKTAILVGFMLSLSSTAIVLKLLQERGELDTDHGKVIMGVIIFDDIIAVLMMLAVPLMSGNVADIFQSVPFLIVAAIGIIALVIVGTVWVAPAIMHRIARTRSSEMFMLCTVMICIIMAWLTSSVGLSLALGAFLAGLILSETLYSHQALGSILPFRHIFASFFFISIGMMLDIRFFIENPLIIIAAAAVGMLIKLCAGTITTLLLGYSPETAVTEGLAMSNVGEFSFILASIGLSFSLLTSDLYQVFLATSILTMAVAPFLITHSKKLSGSICRLPILSRLKKGGCSEATIGQGLSNHMVIIGYGLNGKNIARAAKYAKIPYIVLEMNPDTVISEKAKGEPIHYGDATNEIVLEHAGLEKAKVAVVTIADVAATRMIVSTIRKLNPDIHLIVRARYAKEIKLLKEMGANEVVPEEFETSIELFVRVLKRYFVPIEHIEKISSELRSENYDIFQSPDSPAYSFCDLICRTSDTDIITFRIDDGISLLGKSISEAGLRKKYGVTVLLIHRNNEYLEPDPGTVFQAGDIVFLFGTQEKLTEALNSFRGLPVAGGNGPADVRSDHCTGSPG